MYIVHVENMNISFLQGSSSLTRVSWGTTLACSMELWFSQSDVLMRCTYVHVCTCTCSLFDWHVYMYMNMCVCTCIYIIVCVHVCTCTCSLFDWHVYMYTCIWTCVYIHVHYCVCSCVCSTGWGGSSQTVCWWQAWELSERDSLHLRWVACCHHSSNILWRGKYF